MCVCVFGLENLGHGGEDLFTELWKACAGPLVDVPRNGERVFYFPQGHMEQVSVTLNFFLSNSDGSFSIISFYGNFCFF